jgi:molybdenum storage protein
MSERQDERHHLRSLLMRESLLDKALMSSTESPVVRMLPDVSVVKIGASSIVDHGRARLLPLIAQIGRLLEHERLVVGTGGGARSRHLLSIGIDLGLPTGVLAQLTAADALGNAHLLGTLLAPYGVVAIPPELLGHLLPLFLRAAPAVVFHGVPPYSLWEHPAAKSRVPPHRTDAGCFLLAETFGCRKLVLVKDVDGLYAEDPKRNASADFISEISTRELRSRAFETLPFDRVLVDLLDEARLLDRFELVNGLAPERLAAALAGEHVGTTVYRA